MDQMKLLPGSAGEVFVDFLGQRIRGAMVDGVTYMAAADVGRALGLEGDGGQVARLLDDKDRTLIPNQGSRSVVGVTMAGAMAMALARRRGAPEGIREKLDAVVLALGTGAAAALATPPNPELAALRQEVATLTALVRAIPAPNVEDVARAVAVALETWEAGKYKRRSDAIKAGHARVGWVPKTGKPATPKRPALTEADVLRALRAEMGPVGADGLAKRYRWPRQPVREMLVALEKAGRVEYRHVRHEQGWRVRPEVV